MRQISKRRKNLLIITLTLFLCFTFFTQQIIAISLQLSDNIEIKNSEQNLDNFNQNNSVWFTKPVKGKIYIKDSYEISFFNNIPIIIGPITLKIETEYQSNFIHVIYRFTDMNGNSFGPDSGNIYRNDSRSNYDFFYSKKHSPIPIYPILPSKFNIEVRAYWLWAYIGSQNITVYKIF